MNIYTAHWKYYTDDYYAPHNRRMFLNREDADKFLDDLINYNGIDTYYILEEEVIEKYVPIEYEMMSDWECSFGTLHPHTDICDCDEYTDDYPCDIVNEF